MARVPIGFGMQSFARSAAYDNMQEPIQDHSPTIESWKSLRSIGFWMFLAWSPGLPDGFPTCRSPRMVFLSRDAALRRGG